MAGEQKKLKPAASREVAGDGVSITEGARILSALKWALHEHRMGRPLPKRLVTALLAFDKGLPARTRRDLLLATLVLRYHEQGFPKANTSQGPSAFEKAAEDVGVSASTAQRAYESCEWIPLNGDDPLDAAD
ncbi:hypothetical protein FQY83_02930 [Luteimonas marina]|uniref:Uncharacterized protein n=1 Tax=Luteimonas marina TaxID=488485 RepID=A0A5C5UCG7_9GAMM|nr:hypothetical protein [Luteimonas marina]TWT23599.1 hypothetical protein FQY83_02930 [Luteimonas marina]